MLVTKILMFPDLDMAPGCAGNVLELESDGHQQLSVRRLAGEASFCQHSAKS